MSKISKVDTRKGIKIDAELYENFVQFCSLMEQLDKENRRKQNQEIPDQNYYRIKNAVEIILKLIIINDINPFSVSNYSEKKLLSLHKKELLSTLEEAQKIRNAVIGYLKVHEQNIENMVSGATVSKDLIKHFIKLINLTLMNQISFARSTSNQENGDGNLEKLSLKAIEETKVLVG